MHGNSRWVLAAQVYIWAPPFNHRARRTIEASLEWSRAVRWINIERIVNEYFTLMKKNLLHVDSKWEQLERNDTFIRAVAAAAVASVVSDSERPHRWQPTRLCHPWGSPYRNTGVGCRFLLQCMKVKSESEVAQLCPTLRDPMDCSLPGSSVQGIFQARVLEWGAIAFSIYSSSCN